MQSRGSATELVFFLVLPTVHQEMYAQRVLIRILDEFPEVGRYRI